MTTTRSVRLLLLSCLLLAALLSLPNAVAAIARVYMGSGTTCSDSSSATTAMIPVIPSTVDTSVSNTACFPIQMLSMSSAVLQCFANGTATLTAYRDQACQVVYATFTGQQGACVPAVGGQYASGLVGCGVASLVSPSSYFHHTSSANLVVDPVRSLLYFTDSNTWLRQLSSVTGQELRPPALLPARPPWSPPSRGSWGQWETLIVAQYGDGRVLLSRAGPTFYDAGYIVAFDTNLNLILTLPFLGNTWGADTALAVDSLHRLYTLNNQLMSQYDGDTGALLASNNVTGLDRPWQDSVFSQLQGLSTIDSSDNFHFCETWNETRGCRCWAMSTSPPFTLLSTLQLPSSFNSLSSLFVDDASFLYLSSGADSIYQYRTASILSASGAVLTSYYTGALRTPQFDGHGSLFLLSSTYEGVDRLDGFTAANTTQPTVNNVTFQALPLTFSARVLYDTQLVLDETGSTTNGSLWLVSGRGCTNYCPLGSITRIDRSTGQVQGQYVVEQDPNWMTLRTAGLSEDGALKVVYWNGGTRNYTLYTLRTSGAGAVNDSLSLQGLSVGYNDDYFSAPLFVLPTAGNTVICLYNRYRYLVDAVTGPIQLLTWSADGSLQSNVSVCATSCIKYFGFTQSPAGALLTISGSDVATLAVQQVDPTTGAMAVVSNITWSAGVPLVGFRPNDDFTYQASSGSYWLSVMDGVWYSSGSSSILRIDAASWKVLAVYTANGQSVSYGTVASDGTVYGLSPSDMQAVVMWTEQAPVASSSSSSASAPAPSSSSSSPSTASSSTGSSSSSSSSTGQSSAEPSSSGLSSTDAVPSSSFPTGFSSSSSTPGPIPSSSSSSSSSSFSSGTSIPSSSSLSAPVPYDSNSSTAHSQPSSSSSLSHSISSSSGASTPSSSSSSSEMSTAAVAGGTVAAVVVVLVVACICVRVMRKRKEKTPGQGESELSFLKYSSLSGWGQS